jgi:hypothetical protein
MIDVANKPAAEIDKWPARFGKLVDITKRTSQKGEYITFKLTATPKNGKSFDVYGACFDEEIIAQMESSVGENVWMKGPLETRQVDGEERKSFKVVYFNVSEAKGEAADTAAEAVAEAA